MDAQDIESLGSEVGQNQEPLVFGIPDEIALFCLVRVPRKYHMVLKCVCRRWRDLVCSEEWRFYRRKHNLEETWVYALCRDNKLERLSCYVLDPSATVRSWKGIPEIPPLALKRKGVGFEVLGKNVYLLGGCGWSEDASREVYCYDASMNRWLDAPPLSTARCYFACEVVDEKIYAIGGLGLNSSDTNSWDVYDLSTNMWNLHTDSNNDPEIEDSFVMDGKIFIRCCTSSVTLHVYAVVYDPSNGTWQHADDDMASGWRGPAVVVDGTLYVLDQSSGTRLMIWEKDKREWTLVGRLSALRTRPPCQLVAMGKSIFVVGKGCSTAVIDVGNTGNIGGVMVSSPIPKLNGSDDVISCKCVTI